MTNDELQMGKIMNIFLSIISCMRSKTSLTKIPIKKGFTLVELMIVVGIISILSISAIMGFSGVGESVQAGQSANFIVDIIKKFELEVMTGVYEKSTVSFEEDYLVVSSELKDQIFELDWDNSGCEAEEEGLHWLGSGDLIKHNTKVALNAKVVNGEGVECIDFKNSPDLQWEYQLRSDHGLYYSPVIRFLHFNLDRQNSSNLTILENDYSLEISAPYAKKILYESGLPVYDPRFITVSHPEGFEEEVMIQN